MSARSPTSSGTPPASRELGCDEDEARWEEWLRKVAKQKPESEKPAKRS